MHWDFVLSVPLARNKLGLTHLAVELINEGHVAANTRHPCSKLTIRTRLSAARKVQLLLIPWYEWNRLKDSVSREVYLQTKLRTAGVLV